MKIKIISESPKETQKIACLFTEAILRRGPVSKKKALVVSLEGALGSGKTEFLKGVAKSLRLKERIFSPTFLIMKSFSCLPKKSLRAKDSFKTLWHLDCYRLEKIKNIKELGFREIVEDSKNIIFIEWGDKIRKLLPKKYIGLKFRIQKENRRMLEFQIP